MQYAIRCALMHAGDPVVNERWDGWLESQGPQSVIVFVGEYGIQCVFSPEAGRLRLGVIGTPECNIGALRSAYGKDADYGFQWTGWSPTLEYLDYVPDDLVDCVMVLGL